MLAAIQGINRSGVTILLVEQNAFKALAICDRAIVLDMGRIVLAGSGRDLLQHPGVRSAYLELRPVTIAAPRQNRQRIRADPEIIKYR